MLHTINLLSSSNFPLSLSLTHNLSTLHRPITFPSVLPLRTQQSFCFPQFSELSDAAADDGPIELPSTIFATTDDPSSIQVATSVLLTGAISVFLFRSLRRRAKRVKELVPFTAFLF